MTRQSAEAVRVNPMVGKKLRTTVLTNLEAIQSALADGQVPVIAPNPEKPKDTRAAKFSDIFAYKGFLADNELGEVDIRVTGGKNNPLMQRVVGDYLSKDQTPNCSIQQVLAVEGVKVAIKYNLTDLGKQVVAAGSTEGDGDKPKRIRAKPAKAEKAEPKRARKAAAPKAKAEKSADKPKRTRRTREQIEADNAAKAAKGPGRGRRKAAAPAEAAPAAAQGVEVGGQPGQPKGEDWK